MLQNHRCSQDMVYSIGSGAIVAGSCRLSGIADFPVYHQCSGLRTNSDLLIGSLINAAARRQPLAKAGGLV